jgi:acetoin utilization deacetylase AcuC-like enzyme
MAVSLPPLTNDEEYMNELQDHLPETLERIRPDLVVYNAGSACWRPTRSRGWS